MDRNREGKVGMVCEMVNLNQKPLKHLNRIAKKPPVDIEFQDLCYSVADSKVKGGWRQLLKSISGKFQSGELTAIMGPSGAGKSTLLNILAAYVTAGVKGSIKINGKPRQMKLFNKLSSYIMQEDLVQPRLSVRESMVIAAELKLGSTIGHQEKLAVVDEVIEILGLEKCYDTRTEHLSGGQRRRLAVALELVNNPPVIFLDEPTTGLDNVAIKQCIGFLHKITKLGRTVICTIHQPPSSLFQNFDQVYVMADGYCVFNGSPSKLVPFMSSANFICPPTSTPADYIIELVQSNSENVTVLQNRIQNGKSNVKDDIEKTFIDTNCYDISEIYQDTTEAKTSSDNVEFPTSFWTQFQILLYRMFTQQRRNKTMLYIQFFHHLVSGILLGGIFIGTGNKASQTMSVFKYILSTNVFYMYTYVMSPVLLFPLEVSLLKREYFNRWFGLKAYFCAVTLVNIPILIVNVLLFNSISYLMADHPWELQRFMWFNLLALAIALCSQGLGYAIGGAFEILSGSVVAPHILAVLLALSVYGMGYKDDVEYFMKVLMSMSYLRYGVVGITASFFNEREPLECDELYCHYRDPKILMADMGMANSKVENQLFFTLIMMIIFRVIAYVALKYRMTSELRNRIVHIAVKVIKQNET
ncbi:ATP-binding cassette subfamily G member 4 [Leptinotarsa decemlineata]|uniref:ATP-binding cassette subfamily G member 4 n=1 Tax=Leptinotarsa decemlineata TaxID=7539 RepID=UPI000C255400|nr:ATP-binding cassette sub-family G member 4-like [Leptinotarsa decemlineata]